MAGRDNLRKPCTEIAREMQKKAVQKRAENAKERRILSEAIRERMTDDQFVQIVDNLIKRAMVSDKAFELLRDTLGQKPKESLQYSQTEPFEIIIQTIK